MTKLVEEFEDVCPKCGGTGRLTIPVGFGRGHRRKICEDCKGTGRLDWIERAVRKKRSKGL
jgi:DnaJ-class molecular chaperone